jgi:hypothetical protein
MPYLMARDGAIRTQLKSSRHLEDAYATNLLRVSHIVSRLLKGWQRWLPARGQPIKYGIRELPRDAKKPERRCR